MFDIGLSELIVLFVLGLLILGPERLPAVARSLGRFFGKARSMARNFRFELEREIELEADLKEQREATARAASRPDE